MERAGTILWKGHDLEQYKFLLACYDALDGTTIAG